MSTFEKRLASDRRKKRQAKLKLVQIKRMSGAVEVLAVPPTARLTVYAGRVASAPSGDMQYGTKLAAGGQLRIYLGNQLIGFFPDVLEMYVTNDLLRAPLTLAPPVSIPDDTMASIGPGPYISSSSYISTPLGYISSIGKLTK